MLLVPYVIRKPVLELQINRIFDDKSGFVSLTTDKVHTVPPHKNCQLLCILSFEMKSRLISEVEDTLFSYCSFIFITAVTSKL